MVRLPSSGTAPRLGSALCVIAALLVGIALLPARGQLTSATVALLLVVVVVGAAIVGGSVAAVVTALVAAVTLNVGYIKPYGTLSVAELDKGIELVAFLVVATLVGQLVTGIVRRRSEVTEAVQQVRDLDEHVELLQRERTHLARRATRAEELEDLDRQRTALLRSVSHDLRTPLASVRAVVTDLRDGVEYDDATRFELLTTVSDEVDRLDRLVANLLSLSRIEAGAFTPERQAVDLHDLVDERVRSLAPLLRAVRVRTDVPDDLPLADADYGQLEQVLTNLLANAARYAPNQSDVWVAAAREGNSIRVEVSDQGRGVDPADATRIFEPFVHGVESRSSGIGLAICRSIVEAHDGTIGVRRTFGGGATFSFTIPVHASERT
ncbi:MAG: sensor histidine kinase [Acidimicrobiia bacterium]